MKIAKQVDGLRFSTGLLLVGAITLFIFSGIMWRKFVFLSDNRVVWGAIEKALSTDGVQVTVDDSSAEITQKVVSRLDFSGDLSAESSSEFKNSTIDSLIRTVSTKDKDYLYYERNNNTTNPLLKQLEGKWADISIPGQVESKTLADTYTNGSLIFAGNLSSPDRKKLVNQMKLDKLYTVLGVTKTETVDGKEVRTYKVKISSNAYNASLGMYFDMIGLTQAASEVQSDGSGELQPVFEISVVPDTRSIIATGYPDIGSVGAREYSQWDAVYGFEIPTTFMTAEELQNTIKNLYNPVE